MIKGGWFQCANDQEFKLHKLVEKKGHFVAVCKTGFFPISRVPEKFQSDPAKAKIKSWIDGVPVKTCKKCLERSAC